MSDSLRSKRHKDAHECEVMESWIMDHKRRKQERQKKFRRRQRNRKRTL